MPDQAKLETLRAVNYELLPTCGDCAHARFAPGSNFGSCTLYGYDHAKHGAKKLSVHRAGNCEAFNWNEKKLADVDRLGFTEFVVELLAALCPSCGQEADWHPDRTEVMVSVCVHCGHKVTGAV
jgi:hypothetical protein